jgi:hypothetical protein
VRMGTMRTGWPEGTEVPARMVETVARGFPEELPVMDRMDWLGDKVLREPWETQVRMVRRELLAVTVKPVLSEKPELQGELAVQDWMVRMEPPGEMEPSALTAEMEPLAGMAKREVKAAMGKTGRKDCGELTV